MSRKALDTLIVLLSASVLLIIVSGGLDFEWGGIRLRLHGFTRPLILLAVVVALRTWIATRSSSAPRARATSHADAARPASHAATLVLLSLLLAIAATCIGHHVRVAGGLDSYGYVSAASLLAGGQLTKPQRLVSLLPFEQASEAAAPLGYVPGPDGRSSSPRFPLGLPIVMAAFRIFGASGPFFVPLVMAFAVMALANGLGREPALPSSGLLAAALVGVEPLFAYYAIQPMSDVPAAGWLIGALWLRLRRPDAPFAAGVCAGMAVLTRPALLVASVIVGTVTAERGRLRRTVAFAAALLVFIVLQMAINHALYGSVATSGYGPASYMFELSLPRLTANFSNFGKWLTYSHTLAIWLIWPASLLVLRSRRWAWQISAVAAAAAAPYLFYIVFDDWESSRFLLPAIILVLILFARALAVVLVDVSSRLPPRWAGAPEGLLVAIALVAALASYRFLDREGAFRFADIEAKYPLAGAWIASHTSDRAVVLAALHSGSIRYYGERETIRWDQIPPDRLVPTLRRLIDAGYKPYLALDSPSEPPLFETRFAGSLKDANGRFEPVARVRVVNIFRFVSAH